MEAGFYWTGAIVKLLKPYTTQSKVLLLLHNCCKSFTRNVSNVIIMEFQLTEKEFFTFQIHVEYRWLKESMGKQHTSRESPEHECYFSRYSSQPI